MKVGERVRHRKRLDCGVGELIRVYADGHCDAIFPSTSFSWVPLGTFVSVEEEERQRRVKEEFLLEVRKSLQNDFLGADACFRSTWSAHIFLGEYQREKIEFVQRWAMNATGTNLDDQQAAAVACVHGNIRVTARAGSGKTTTLVNRALFLLKHCGVAPSEMLLLAFNRKAALEIRRRLLSLLSEGAEVAMAADITRRIREASKRKRIGKDDKEKIEAKAVDAIAARSNVALPHVMTFHALAYAIVHSEESLLYDGAEGDSQALSRAVQRVIDDHLQIPTFKAQIRELMLAHFREDWEHIVEGCYDRSKEEFLQFRRSLPRESLRGEYVKSFGEKVIADFLFEYDIAYKYERNHSWNGINYHPDFTIFQTPKSGTIIEYFGLKGDVDYDEMSEAKRSYWEDKPGWTLLEFAPHDLAAHGIDAFLALLKDRLEEHGIPCARLSEDEIWHRIKDRAIDRFTTAMARFIGRCRKRSLSPAELRSLIDSHQPLSPVEKLFLNLAHYFYVAYLNQLSATGDEDFDGLMQRAADGIEAGKTWFERKSGGGDLTLLRYVCVDEFQDFSDLFYRLLNAIRKQNPRIELFCVGDDWQAINGFAGSELQYFENFKDYIGESRCLYISTNYRSSNAIVAAGNALMEGLGKPAMAHKQLAGAVLVADLNEFEPTLIERERHSGDIITPAVLRIANKALEDGLDLVMLNRANYLNWYVDQFESKTLGGFLESIRSFFPKGLKERIAVSTVHQYKGLEKPMVIVLDAVARSYPLIHPDWAFSRILGDSPEKITEEERRLLYVALTRAVERLVIITDGRNKSPFLDVLEHKQPLSAIKWADYPPACSATTRLIVKVGNQDRRGGAPTFAIKDLLKAMGYQWQSTGWPGWAKSFPVEGFKLETLKSEVWAVAADGIEIRVFNDEDLLISRYLINRGIWCCNFDNLAQVEVGKLQGV